MWKIGFSQVNSNGRTQHGFEVFSFFSIPPQFCDLPNLTINSSFLCNHHSPVLKDIFPWLVGSNLSNAMNESQRSFWLLLSIGGCWTWRTWKGYSDLKRRADHSIGNSSLSARETGFSKKLFFNLWILMFEWGWVADLSVSPLWKEIYQLNAVDPSQPSCLGSGLSYWLDGFEKGSQGQPLPLSLPLWREHIFCWLSSLRHGKAGLARKPSGLRSYLQLASYVSLKSWKPAYLQI